MPRVLRRAVYFFLPCCFLLNIAHAEPPPVKPTFDPFLFKHDKPVYTLAFSPDGKLLASGGDERDITLWDPTNGQRLRRLVGHTGKVWSAAFSPDGALLATASDDDSLRIWDVASGKELRRVAGQQGVQGCVVFSPDGKTLASGGNDPTPHLWDAATGKEIRRFKGHGGNITSLAFSPDGKSLVSGSWDHRAILWDAATGAQVRQFVGHTDMVRDVLFSPDGRTIVTGGWDATLRVWEAPTGAEAARLEGHTGAVIAVAVSPDGRALLSGANDQTVRLWDLPTGKEVAQLWRHDGGGWATAFSPDGRLLASGSQDATVRLAERPSATPKRTGDALEPAELALLWSQLDGADAVLAHRAIWKLTAHDEGAVAYLRDRLKHPSPPDAEKLARWLRDLDDADFAVRETASAELSHLGDRALPAVKKALQARPSLEAQRRLDELAEKFTVLSGERLRCWRTIAVLERIGTPTARAVLTQFAAAADDDLAEEARTSVERLRRRETGEKAASSAAPLAPKETR